MRTPNASSACSADWRNVRDALLFLIIFGSIPFIFKRPAWGALMFTWISLMNPHRLSYGAAYDFPFAALIAGVTLLSTLISREPKRIPMTPVVVLLLIFAAFMTLTSFFALEPLLVWREWNRVIKTLFMVLLSAVVLNTEKDVKHLAVVIALSLGIYGLKGGLFTLASGGSYRVYGPEGSYIAENNSMALALVMTLPLIWYMRSMVSNRILKLAVVGMTLFTVISTMGSYSRGALVGGAMMLGFLWLKSERKLGGLIAIAVVVAVVATVMPDQWFDRMNTIGEYKEDGSALGRLNAWKFAINVANDNVLGGGYNVFSQRMFFIYAPDPLDYHVAHSIFFQVLGDHGYIGLLMYLLLMPLAWRSGSRIIKHGKDKPELKWAVDLSRMCQVSIVGYAVGGAFLSLAYFDLYYDILLLLVLMDKIILGTGMMKQTVPAAAHRQRPPTSSFRRP